MQLDRECEWLKVGAEGTGKVSREVRILVGSVAGFSQGVGREGVKKESESEGKGKQRNVQIRRTRKTYNGVKRRE
jgi:hypothetical protein